MRNLIVGTAGHIDHGKTSLVRALTGIDTDRLEEEKRRGISIDLGFANLQLGEDLRIGIVDVPGHERFVKNMLAGVGGIDLVLFVVAADESIKPQTREHFDICRLLRIPRGIVVLTKADLVDPDLLELVRLEVDEFVAGSFLEGAPMVAVSSTTGAGIDELKKALQSAAAAIPLKDASRRTRLPIDRAFSMRGFGTIVTGTLYAGAMQVEQELEVHPGGRRVRVRGLQVHGAAVKKAHAGQRTAVNLAGAADPGDLARGMALTEPNLFQATQGIDAVLELLASAPVPLKHQSPVHFHAGSAEVEASVRLLEGTKPVQPGSRTYVRILLREPVLLLPRDRFIIRMFSPVMTIGGGTVLEIAPPVRMKRVDVVRRLKSIESGSIRDRLAIYVRESKFGLTAAELVARTGWLQSEIDANSDGVLVLRAQQSYVDRGWAHGRVAKFRDVLKEFHRRNPLLPGMQKEELRSRELAGAPPYLLDALLVGLATRDVVAEEDVVRLASHRVMFQQDEEEALARIEAAFEEAGLAVPSIADVLAKSGVEGARAKSLLAILLKKQKLVKAGSEDLLFHPSAIAKLKGLVSLRRGQKFGVSEFKEWTGVSRKYAIPLLEFLDRERVTRREGDSRVVL